MVYTTTLSVRTYECDQYGHVNNANYLNYLEYARCEYLKDAGFPYHEVVNAGYGIYVARIEIDYKRPAFPNDSLTIETCPVKKGAVSGVIAQTIKRGDEVLAQASVTWAFVDKNGAPCRIPPQYNIAGLSPE